MGYPYITWISATHLPLLWENKINSIKTNFTIHKVQSVCCDSWDHPGPKLYGVLP